jgi:hypothetical protein
MTDRSMTPLLLHPSDLTVQTAIRLPLPLVVGNQDYAQREKMLLRMDEILRLSGIEDAVLAAAVQKAVGTSGPLRTPLSDSRREHVQTYARQALRCTIARFLSNTSHRQFSCYMAESRLLQWFCGTEVLGGPIQVPSKSTLQRMESQMPADILDRAHALLLSKATAVSPVDGSSILGLAEPIDLSVIWMDSTCMQLDIHYPTDWILLRDATRTIMKSILTIRAHGLKHRMEAPESFIAAMNSQCMAMSGCSRKGRGPDKKKQRKKILRTMKKIACKVRQHGKRYRDFLQKRRDETDLSVAQAQVIIDRMDNVLGQLPAAINQAHDRIIGERVVPNDEKILSFYEPHARVYVRGKSGADAEFGLQLLLSETLEGLIVDCHLVPDRIASDSKLLKPAIARMRKQLGDTVAETVVTDRGFTSAANNKALEKLKIINATLPRQPDALKKFLEDPHFRDLHTRRAQTEARIGIFKNKFIGGYLPTKGLDRQKKYIAWATLAHNLWVLARRDLPDIDEVAQAS